MRSGDMARRAVGEGARSNAGLPWQEVQCCWNTANPNSVPLRSGTAAGRALLDAADGVAAAAGASGAASAVTALCGDAGAFAAPATCAARPSGKSHDHTFSIECALRSRIGAPRFVLAVTILHELPSRGAASCGHGRSGVSFRIAKT